MFRHTKIGATIGPACEDPKLLLALAEAGMDFARLNFSHGSYDSHRTYIRRLRSIEKKTRRFISIMQDLTGPRIRVGVLPAKGVAVAEGSVVRLRLGTERYQGGAIPVNYAGLEKQLAAGERVLIDDGRIEAAIVKRAGAILEIKIVQGGVIRSHKGLNFPDTALALPAIQTKDRQDLAFGIEAGIDTVAMSFVKDAADIKELRELIKKLERFKKGSPPIQIFAKIERHEAVRNIDEIIEAADGIMVARGDLGLELLEAEVPLIQKKIIDTANSAGKPVIVATQLLDSMQTSRRPTRAEVSDVANAVIDHADALLLTNETAAGQYPLEAVKTMAEIVMITEDSSYDDTPLPKLLKKGSSVNVALTELSRILAEEVNAKCILAGSLTGETGRLLSHVRPPLPIMVATEDIRAARQLNISWGVWPFLLLPCNSIEQFVRRSATYLKKEKFVKAGDKIIIVAGEPVGQAGNVNVVEVREVR